MENLKPDATGSKQNLVSEIPPVKPRELGRTWVIDTQIPNRGSCEEVFDENKESSIWSRLREKLPQRRQD